MITEAVAGHFSAVYHSKLRENSKIEKEIQNIQIITVDIRTTLESIRTTSEDIVTASESVLRLKINI